MMECIRFIGFQLEYSPVVEDSFRADIGTNCRTAEVLIKIKLSLSVRTRRS